MQRESLAIRYFCNNLCISTAKACYQRITIKQCLVPRIWAEKSLAFKANEKRVVAGF